MKNLKRKYGLSLMTLLISFILTFPYPGLLKGTEIPPARDVVTGKAELPTIEDLTDGEVKKGDLIDKNNMDLVKQWLTPGTIEAINQGMVLIMGTNSKSNTTMPKAYLEATKRNKGKAVMDETGVAYYEKIGTPWPGGNPFPEPKSGLEVMACSKYGIGVDDFTNIGALTFVNSKGKVYKTIGMTSCQIWCNTRIYFPPLGTAPGFEDQMFRRISTLTSPIEIKGQGTFAVRYYDDAKTYDSGFNYFPAYKRTLRVSSTTWQDNIAGSDMLAGDSEGFKEPYVDWDFKLLGTKYFLIPEYDAPFTYFDKEGKLNPKLKFDVGRRWPRMGWAVFPMHVVEAIPRVKHVYGKKVLYECTAPFFTVSGQAHIMEPYDRQGKLWKFYCNHNGDFDEKWNARIPWGIFITDLQSQHTTQFWFNFHINQDLKPLQCSFKELLKLGR